MADEDTKKKLKLRLRILFKDVIVRNIRECMDIVSGELDLEKEIRVTSTIDIIKKKAAAVKKLEEEIVDITTDDSLLEEMVNEGMTFKIYCTEQLPNQKVLWRTDCVDDFHRFV